LNYVAWQSVPQICCSVEEKFFSVLLPCNFFELFKTVTSHLICDDLETIAFVYFVDVMHNLVHLNEISSLSPLH
jgi:hypothetical protein